MRRRAPGDPDATPAPLRSSTRALRAVVPALGVLALLGVVTVAATGSTPRGSGSSTSPADSLLDTVFSLMLVALAVTLAAVVFVIVRWREHEWTAPRKRRDLHALASLLAFGFALALYVRLRGWHLSFDPQQTPLDRGEGSPPAPSLQAGSDPGYQFEFAWLPVVVVLALAAVGAAALVLSARRRQSSEEGVALAGDLAVALDLTLDDLRAEADPRRAVIGAYARLERVLAAHGEPRRPADTPEEHVSRVLSTLDVDRSSIRRLADLFVRAEFSQHHVDSGMKDEAIDALEHVRDELRAAGRRPRGAPAAAGVPA